MPVPDRRDALDHVVVVMFENRSFDNLLGRLYEPGEVASFEGVLGKELSNPIPEWAEHGAERGSRALRGGGEHGHAQPGPGRGVPARQHPAVRADRPAQQPGHAGRPDGRARSTRRRTGTSADDGRVRGRLHQRVQRRDGPPARLRGVRADHDRLYAGADAGPLGAGPRLRDVRPLVRRGADADVRQPLVLPCRDLLRLCRQRPRTRSSRSTTRPRRCSSGSTRTGCSWRVYATRRAVSVHRADPRARLRDRFATHFVATDQFLEDAERGELPTYSFIEPQHVGTATTTCTRRFGAVARASPSTRPPRCSAARRCWRRSTTRSAPSSSSDGSNCSNTLLMVIFDEHGGTYDHVPPPAAPPPDPAGAGRADGLWLRPARRPHARDRDLALDPRADRRQRRLTATPR